MYFPLQIKPINLVTDAFRNKEVYFYTRDANELDNKQQLSNNELEGNLQTITTTC